MQITTETDNTRNESKNVTNFNRKRVQKRQQQHFKWKSVILRSINIKLMHKQKHSFPLAQAWPSNDTTISQAHHQGYNRSLNPLIHFWKKLSLFQRSPGEVMYDNQPSAAQRVQGLSVVCNRLLKIDLERVPLVLGGGGGYHPGF